MIFHPRTNLVNRKENAIFFIGTLWVHRNTNWDKFKSSSLEELVHGEWASKRSMWIELHCWDDLEPSPDSTCTQPPTSGPKLPILWPNIPWVPKLWLETWSMVEPWLDIPREAERWLDIPWSIRYVSPTLLSVLHSMVTSYNPSQLVFPHPHDSQVWSLY